jgi:Zn-dependent protease
MNLKLGTFLNVPLYFNFFTIFIFVWALIVGGTFALSFCLLSFLFVVMHEYGHVFMAQRFGWHVQDVIILPIGGVARMNFKHNTPKEEILVALAGPAVNLILLLVFIALVTVNIILDNTQLVALFGFFGLVNFIILVFNLLPVFPMDGGRVLRAILSLCMPHETATLWAVRSGRFFGGLLGIGLLLIGAYLTAIVVLAMVLFSGVELENARVVAVLYKTRSYIAKELNKPELLSATVPELIIALKEVRDKELRQKLNLEELLPLLNGYSDVSI